MVKANAQFADPDADARVKQQSIPRELTRLLSDINDMAPELAGRAAEIESARHVPADIVDTLRHMGVFRTLLPRSHGGMGLSVPDVVPVIEALSATDSSVGWVAMIGTTSQTFCTRLPRPTFDRIFMSHPDTIVTGVGTPAGKAELIDGGYRVTGRWPFASGCQRAQWIVGHCVVHKAGLPVMSDAGPVTRFVLLPAERWRIEETWVASGLTGSGSHHVSLDDVIVPEADSFDLFHGPSCLPGPFASSIAPFIGDLHAAVAIGIAAGALADLAAMAISGRRQLFATTDLRDAPVFQHEMGKLDAALRAARALLQVQAERHWDRATVGLLDEKADFTEGLQGSAWIHATCNDVVSGCYTLGGSSVVYNASPLQRRLRDIHAARQHVAAQERIYARAGANALGFAPVNPISGL
jgi:alkylation response protein AidB-like acyl-CoA dehydrogenase